MEKILRAIATGSIAALIVWILSGSDASIGIGFLIFYLEVRK